MRARIGGYRRAPIAVELDFHQPWHRPGSVFGDLRLAPYRLGQQSFKAVVLDSYHRRCAISGTHIPPVLQAAHIRPVAKGGEHRLDNGLLLRSDVHTLFDRGYLGVDPQHRLPVSRWLRRAVWPAPGRCAYWPSSESIASGASLLSVRRMSWAVRSRSGTFPISIVAGRSRSTCAG